MSSKRDRVLARSARRRSPLGLVAGALLVVLGAVVLTLTVDPFGLLRRPQPAAKLSSRTYDAAQPVAMTAIEPEYRSGKIYVDLAQVDKAGIVSFALAGKAVTLPNGSAFDALPMTVFVAPSGKVVAAVSFCEPCSGTSFHIRGNLLVCNVCGTQWSLEKLKGVSGGCLAYPPDEVSYSVDGANLVLDENELRAWVPRG